MFGWIESLFRAPAAVEKKAWAPSPRMDLGLRRIKGSFIEVEGLPQPQWELIGHELEKHHPGADVETLWHSAAFEWLETLGSALGERFHVHESPNFLFLTAKTGGSQRYLKDSAERALQQLVYYFGNAVLHEPGHGKHVIVFLEDEDTYYRYISHFYSAGEHPTSGGIFINSGYRHLVLLPSATYEALLVHELSHCAGAPLALPRWLDEGLAQWMEGSVAGLHRTIDRHLHARHREFWTPVTIQRFWSGQSFFEVGEGVELSYSLAEILMRRLHEDFPEAVRDFVAAAKWQDCGQAAAKAHLKVSLGELASLFLGPGEWDWVPVPAPGPSDSPDLFDGKWPLLLDLVRAGRVDEARPLWEKRFAEATPADQASILDAVACIPLEQDCKHFVPEALELSEQSLSLDPTKAELHTTLGGLLLRAGKLDKAAEVLRKIASGPHEEIDRAVAFYFLASAVSRLGNRVQAEAAYAEALKLAPHLSLRWETELELFGTSEPWVEAEV